MTPPMDAEIAAVLAPTLKAMKSAPPLEPGDWRTRRELFGAALAAQAHALPVPADVTVTPCSATAKDGTTIPMRLYRRDDTRPSSLAVYIHGGGMFLGSLDTHDTRCRIYTHLSGVALLSVGYRLAPEHPHPIPVEDCYAALRCSVDNAPGLGIGPARIAIMGDSASGGLAAAAALLARDRRGSRPRRRPSRARPVSGSAPRVRHLRSRSGGQPPRHRQPRTGTESSLISNHPAFL
ncbi:alpha/beta hydrolase [Streptomyces sp. OE57]|uniref:alpha/beta hydrolase n=1 Tax=Streptomyces lacaronensis TaxID=3379885 RepID=UPI0039B723F4